MSKIAGIAFYGFFGSIALLGAGVYYAGQNQPEKPTDCSTKPQALLAAKDFHLDIGGGEQTGQFLLPTERGFEVTLLFGGDRTAVYSVAQDCTVKFA